MSAPAGSGAAGGGDQPRSRLRRISQSTDAIRRMYARAAAEPAGSTAGLILGGRSETGVVDLADLVASAWRGAATPGLERSLRELLDRAAADAAEVVGWYVVRPASAGAIDDELLAIHAALFPGWWQIALIVDPGSRQYGIYGRRDGKLARLGGRGGGADRPPPAHPASPRRTRRQRGAEGVGPAWNVRAAIAVPLCAGVIGGVVLAILR